MNLAKEGILKKLISFLTLFTSFSTLICCALPALLVSLGLGAALSGFLSVFPQLIWVSEHKILVFTTAGVGLLVSGYFQWRARFEPCPVDPHLRLACMTTRVWNFRIYLFSLIVFFIGFFFAFLINFVT